MAAKIPEGALDLYTFTVPGGGERHAGFLRLQEAADMIGVHRNTLRRMWERGEIAPPQVITARCKGYCYDYLVEFNRSRPAAQSEPKA